MPEESSTLVDIVEVGPRDGLQNEGQILSADRKVALIEGLAEAGLKRIEAGSFVSPKQVPQMADTSEVFAKLRRLPTVTYSALVPNGRGLEAALQAGVEEIAVFASPSESFARKNIQSSIADSLARYEDVVAQALRHRLRVRGYVSCVLGCPYEGAVPLGAVDSVAHRLLEMGCFEISLGDTIGSGTPESTRELLGRLLRSIPPAKLAVHFHDTGGRALENIWIALEGGIRVIDTSIAGLGGCPFAPGSPGNVATERVVAALHARKFATGVNQAQVNALAQRVADMLGRRPGRPAQNNGD